VVGIDCHIGSRIGEIAPYLEAATACSTSSTHWSMRASDWRTSISAVAWNPLSR